MNVEYERKSYLAAECKICDEYVVSDSESDYISLREHENYSGPHVVPMGWSSGVRRTADDFQFRKKKNLSQYFG